MLVGELPRRHGCDPARVVVSGPSMGGRGCWELAYARANRLALIASLCTFPIPTLAPRLGDLPVWSFPDELDEVVPVARAEEIIAALRRAGNAARFTRFSDAGRDCTARVYRDGARWRWFAEQNARD